MQKIIYSNYLELVMGEDMQAKRAVVLSGLPGSGKSTLAEILKDLYGYEYVSTDVARAKLLKLTRGKYASTGEYKRLKGQVYDFVRELAGVALGQGKRVVVDGTHLNELATRYRVFILSNGSGAQVKYKLEMLGLGQAPFEFILSCYDHGFAKPDPAPFNFALTKLGLPAEAVVYVGDREAVDVAGAVGVGMGAIIVGGKGETAARARIETVYDIVSVL